MATTTTATTETTFGCDLLVRPSRCTGAAETVVTTTAGLAVSCLECAAERADLEVAAGDAPF